MHSLNLKFAFIFVVFLCSKSFAQQDPIFTQYLMNQFVFNPAYAGTYDVVTANAATRYQWIGPNTFAQSYVASGHSTLPTTNKVGVGAIVQLDRIGINRESKVSLAYSYKIPLNDYTKISVGLQGTWNSYGVNFDRLNFDPAAPQDPNFPADGGVYSASKINFGSGVLLTNDEKYYIGFSVPRILNQSYEKNGVQLTNTRRHMYLSGGYIFGAGGNLPVRASGLVRYVQGAPLSADLTASFLLSDRVWAGITARNFNTIGLLAQLDITDLVMAGYSFDMPLNNLALKNLGTHELQLRINLAVFKLQTVTKPLF